MKQFNVPLNLSRKGYTRFTEKFPFNKAMALARQENVDLVDYDYKSSEVGEKYKKKNKKVNKITKKKELIVHTITSYPVLLKRISSKLFEVYGVKDS